MFVEQPEYEVEELGDREKTVDVGDCEFGWVRLSE
jgi:hypothetical protein